MNIYISRQRQSEIWCMANRTPDRKAPGHNTTKANHMHNISLTITLQQIIKIKNYKPLHVSNPVGSSTGSTDVKQYMYKTL
jgi:hypothetical protein